MSISDALSAGLPSLVTMRKDNEVLCLSLVTGYLIGLNEFLNVQRKMNEGQMRETARLIIQEFYFMHLGDIKLAFDRIKTGVFGNLYEGIDGMKIIMAIRDYQTDRLEAGERQSYNQIQERKMAEREGLPMAVEVAVKLKEVIKPKAEPEKEEQRKWSDFNPQEKILVEQYLGLERTWRKENPGKSKYLFEKEYMSLNEYVRVNTPPTAGNNG